MTILFENAVKKFNSKYIINDNGCWIWTGRKDKDGYGEFRMTIDNVVYRGASRVSYFLHKGKIPLNFQILHRCSEDHKMDNKSCVNPDHLYAGSHMDNMADLVRSQKLKGKNNPNYGIATSEEKKEKISVSLKKYFDNTKGV